MKKSIYSISLIASASMVIVGALFKIQHWEGSDFLFSLGAVTSLPFIYLGIKDAFDANKNAPMLKLMWTIGFIFISWITGLVYHQQFRQRNSK